MEKQDSPMIFEDNFCDRRNIAWRVEPGQVDPNNPLLYGEMPWDGATPFYNGTVLKDPIDGLWKMWGINSPLFAGHKWAEWDFRMGYAISEDGVHWTRPMLEGFPCLGHEKSNVLLDFPDGGSCYQIDVMADPDAEPHRRYEMFILRNPSYKNPTKRIRGLPLLEHHKDWWGNPAHPWGVYRYFSPDGIHWAATEGPLPVESADSLFVYRDIGAPYVAYHKLGPDLPPGSAFAPHDCGAGTVRVLVRRVSQDGTTWSDPPQRIMFPDWRDAHDTQFMDIGPLRQGGGYVATVAVFHALNQMMDIQFAGSPDGVNWFRPIPRVPCIHNGALGDCAGGHIFQSHRLAEDGGRLHLYYFGGEGLHEDLFTEVSRQRVENGQESCYPTGGLCRASWEVGRLWSIVPSAAGASKASAAAMLPKACAGKRLFINALTLGDGEISAELITGDQWEPGPALPGYGREDSDVFRGDSKCTALTWRGGDKCPEEARLARFHLTRARLYGFEWR